MAVEYYIEATLSVSSHMSSSSSLFTPEELFFACLSFLITCREKTNRQTIATNYELHAHCEQSN